MYVLQPAICGCVVSGGASTADRGREAVQLSVNSSGTPGMTSGPSGRPGSVAVGQPRVVVEESGISAAIAAARMSRPVPDVDKSSDQLSAEPSQSAPLGAVVTPVLVADEFDICIAGHALNVPSVSKPPALSAEVAAVPVPQHDAPTGSTSACQPNTSAALQPQVAAEAGAEIPSSMTEDVMLWMYDDCCPTIQCVSAADLPNELTFILMYVDKDDSSFFWAALLYGGTVCCCCCCFIFWF